MEWVAALPWNQWQASRGITGRLGVEYAIRLNQTLKNRDMDRVIGEIVWHFSALATLFDVQLSDVINANVKKINYRRPSGEPTKLHDEGFDQQFPREFEISFLTIADGRSRMYLNGKRLGDDLTDNYYEDDGYRFHDVMHLANAAVLGWSPVLRKLLGKKRRHDQATDEVEDGARATIVEEAIVKAIHTEGTRAAKQTNNEIQSKPVRLFACKKQITFKFIKFIREFVDGLEVDTNQAWEWENAILQGYEVFHELCKRQQGTVKVDLDNRKLEYRSDVFADVNGSVGGIGSSNIDRDNCTVSERDKFDNPSTFLTSDEQTRYLSPSNDDSDFLRILVVKEAILSAMGISTPALKHYNMLEIDKIEGATVSTRAMSEIQQIMWDKNIICFRNTLSETATTISCVSLAMTDPTDLQIH